MGGVQAGRLPARQGQSLSGEPMTPEAGAALDDQRVPRRADDRG